MRGELLEMDPMMTVDGYCWFGFRYGCWIELDSVRSWDGDEDGLLIENLYSLVQPSGQKFKGEYTT